MCHAPFSRPHAPCYNLPAAMHRAKSLTSSQQSYRIESLIIKRVNMLNEEKAKKFIKDYETSLGETDQADWFQQLTEYIGGSVDSAVEFIESANELDLSDEIHEIADSNISVYTADQLKWLTDNWANADQENAVACGAKTADQIAAWCWYEANCEELNEVMHEFADHIEESGILDDDEE